MLGTWDLSSLAAETALWRTLGPLLEDERPYHPRHRSLPSGDTSRVKENFLDHSAPTEQPRPEKPPNDQKDHEK